VLFVAILTHTPENCFGRPEHAKAFEEIKKSWAERERLQRETGVKVIGAYINPNEHTFFFVLDTDKYENVARFLGPTMLIHHSAKITPVQTEFVELKLLKA